MAGVVPMLILLDEASIYTLLDLAIDLVELGLVERGMDAASLPTLQTLV